jgi:ClpP class serine protease
MSGGTLIALACDEIVVESHAALGPVDPQLGQHAAASYVEVARMPGDRDDQTLLMADVSRKAIAQVEGFTARLLARRMPPERAAEVARLLATEPGRTIIRSSPPSSRRSGCPSASAWAAASAS